MYMCLMIGFITAHGKEPPKVITPLDVSSEVKDEATPETREVRMKYLKEYTLSFCSPQQRGMHKQTAFGKPVVPYWTAATTQIRGLPAGTIIWIEDFGFYEISDTFGPGTSGDRLDLYVETIEEANDLGIKHKKVWIVLND